MNKILTIDFDVIMWPHIDLYNNLVNGQFDAIEEIEQAMPLIKYADADLELYRDITNYLIKVSKKISIEFIDTHEDVLNFIPYNSTVINVDHHHDLGYMEPEGELTCGNWVKIGIDNKQINNYIWINNINSDMPINKKVNTTLVKNIDWTNFIIPDKIIICSSFSWIPTNIRPLYLLWKDLFTKEVK